MKTNQQARRVRCEVIDGVAMVTLSSAERRNGVDLPMLVQMRAVQRGLRRRRDVRAAIIHGEGPDFCAGLDFKSVLADRGGALRGLLSLWLPWRNRFQAWSMGWRELPFPVIAAIHGHCLGAGLQLALGADLRVAAEDARLSFMEARWGLVPDMGGAALMRELLRIDQAKELVLSGRTVDAGEALQLGLVSYLDADPLARARHLADGISAGSPDAVAAGKFLLQESWRASANGALAAERRRQRSLIGRFNQRLAIRRNLRRTDPPPPYRPRRIDR